MLSCRCCRVVVSITYYIITVWFWCRWYYLLYGFGTCSKILSVQKIYFSYGAVGGLGVRCSYHRPTVRPSESSKVNSPI